MKLFSASAVSSQGRPKRPKRKHYFNTKSFLTRVYENTREPNCRGIKESESLAVSTNLSCRACGRPTGRHVKPKSRTSRKGTAGACDITRTDSAQSSIKSLSLTERRVFDRTSILRSSCVAWRPRSSREVTVGINAFVASATIL